MHCLRSWTQKSLTGHARCTGEDMSLLFVSDHIVCQWVCVLHWEAKLFFMFCKPGAKVSVALFGD
jgi:hypothetical protein